MKPSEFLIPFFSRPIVRVSVALARYELDDDSSTEYCTGNFPVLLFSVDLGDQEHTVALLGRQYDLLWEELDYSRDFLQQIKDFVCRAHHSNESYIGLASVNFAMSPVPGWPELTVTKITVIEQGDALLGISLDVALGTKLGVFVAPNPGITMVFNDQCDVIVGQAKRLHHSGKLTIREERYKESETLYTLQEIDWFDWLS